MGRFALVLVAFGLVACVDDPIAPPADGGFDEGTPDLPDVDLAVSDLANLADLPDLPVVTGDLALPYDSALTTPVFAAENPGLFGGELIGLSAGTPSIGYTATPYAVFVTNNAGVDWSRLASQPALAAGDTITAIGASTDAIPIVAIGTAQGFVHLRTQTGGWQLLVNVGGMGPGSLPSTVKQIAIWRGYVFAAGSAWIVRWNLSGQNWELVDDQTGETNLLLYRPATAATDHGLWVARASGLYSIGAPDMLLKSKYAVDIGGASLLGLDGGTIAAMLAPNLSPYRYDSGLGGKHVVCTAPPGPLRLFSIAPNATMLGRTDSGYYSLTTCLDTWDIIEPDASSRVTSFEVAGVASLGWGPAGLFRSDTLSVVDASTGIDAVAINALAASATDPTIVWAATSRGLYVHGPTGWTAKKTVLGRYEHIAGVAVSPASHQRVAAWIQTAGQNLTTSSDGGTSWQLATTPGSVRVVAFSIDDPKRALACTASGLATSSDGALTWQVIATDAGTSVIQNCMFLAAHPTIPGTYFAAENELDLYISKDSGETWSPLAPGKVPAGAIRQILPVPTSTEDIYVVNEFAGLIRTTGTDVSGVTKSIDNIRQISLDPLDSNRILVASATAVSLIDAAGDGGVISSGVGFLPQAILVHPADRRQTWVGTLDHGAFLGQSMLTK